MSTDKTSGNGDKESVLVVMATGKMGRGISNAFSASGRYRVFGTSRKANKKNGVTLLAFDWTNVKASMRRALLESQATVVVRMQALVVSKTTTREVQHGREMIDACLEEPTTVRHVILCGNMHAAVAPASNRLVHPKHQVEEYLRNKFASKSAPSDCHYSILGTTSFFENFDDAVNHNPLRRGRLADLYPPTLPVTHVSTLDIGKAAVAVAVAGDPSRWHGEKLDTVASVDTGEECAAALSEVSGVACHYRAALPDLVMRLILPDVYTHVVWARGGGFELLQAGDTLQKKVAEFRSVVPDAMGPQQWFASVGQWLDGSKFGKEAPPPSAWSSLSIVSLTVTVGVVSALISISLKWYGAQKNY